MSKFFPTSWFKWIDPKEFKLNKYSKNNSKAFGLEVQYSKELRELHIDYSLSLDKREIKRKCYLNINERLPISKKFLLEMLKNWCLNILIKNLLYYENLQLSLRLGWSLKKVHCVLEFNQSRWLKHHVEFNMQKTIEAEKTSFLILQWLFSMNLLTL